MPAPSIALAPPRGMRDFYPEDMVRREAVFAAWRRSALAHGFQPYDASVVESLPLLKRKAGEEIVGQIYHFKDKSGRDLALRPEMTPTLARMIAARQGALALPLKWYTIAQCFRYERTTRGRKREHFQWNLDVVGEPSEAAEIELLSAAVSALRRLGIADEEFLIRYSNRALLSDLLEIKGIPRELHPPAFLALDKRGKLGDEETAALLSNAGVDGRHCRAVFDLLEIRSLEDAAAAGGDAGLPSIEALLRFRELAGAYGLDERLRFDLGLVRGLAYYTGIVFEGFDTAGKLRALFGGGRYDGLLESIGGKHVPAAGLGFGDVVVMELLEELDRAPPAEPACQVAIGFMTPREQRAAVGLAARLRDRDRSVDLALAPQKARAFFSYCNKRGFAEAVYLGPDDIARGTARLKDLATREERELALA